MSLDVTLYAVRRVDVYSANITHNLNTMASEAGIYNELWRPDEIGATHAGDLIAPLERGLELLRSDEPRFRAFDASNGKKLWSYQAGAGVNAPAVSYTVGKKQYVAVAAGGNTQLDFKRGNSVVVFALP